MNNNYKFHEECLGCPINLHCFGECGAPMTIFGVPRHEHKYCLHCQEWMLVSEAGELRVHDECRFVQARVVTKRTRRSWLRSFIASYIKGHANRLLVERLLEDLCEACTQKEITRIEDIIALEKEMTTL